MDTRDVEGRREMLYSRRVEFPIKKLLTYRCTRCGHEWSKIGIVEDESTECMMGCSNPPLWLALMRIWIALLTRRDVFGWGKLIKSEKLDVEGPIPKW